MQVDMDSSVWLASGLMVAIMIVLQFPPRLSLDAQRHKPP